MEETTQMIDIKITSTVRRSSQERLCLNGYP
jgi:hypothetical protein